MAQVNDTQATKNGTATGLFASLRASFSIDSVKGGLFANLLSQSKASDATAALAQDASPTFGGQAADSRAAVATTAPKCNAAPVDTGDEDEARVRDMLKQVRDDINQIRADKKRADDARNDAAADKKSDAKTAKCGDDKPAVTVDAKSDDKPAVTKDDDQPAQTEVVAAAENTIKEDTAKKPDVEVTVAAAVEDKIDTNTSSDDKASKDILAELVATEQALALMLQKMTQEKAANLQVAGTQTAAVPVLTTGTVDAVKNVSGKSAVKDKTDAGLAAAFGAGVSSAKAAPDELPDDVQLPVDKKVAADTVLPKIADEKAAAKGAATSKAIDLAALFHPANNDAPPVAAPVAPVIAAAAAPAAKPVAAESESGAALRTIGAASTTTNTTPLQAEGARPTGSYDFASQLSAQRATKGGTAGLPPAIEQVALQLHKMVKDGHDQMTLQLRPADLGRIEIKLDFSKDGSNTVTGTVVADSQATLDMLQKDSGGLQRALQDAGLRADANSLQFSLRDGGQQNGFAQNTNGQSQSGNQSGGYKLAADDDADFGNANVEETYYLAPGRVNLRV